MDRTNFFKFLLIALALPAQYYISQNWSYDNTQQSLALQNVLESLKHVKRNYLEIESWKKWFISHFIDIPAVYRKNSAKTKYSNKNNDEINFDEEDIAIEVYKYRQQLVNFAESSVTRSPRPSKIKFRVGQVIKHKKLELYGVIIGWDERAMAPDSWLERNYHQDEQEFINQPHYLVLVDEKYQDKFTGKAYVAQDEIELVVNNRIKHAHLSLFFSRFDGDQYLKRKYLQTVYPHD